MMSFASRPLITAAGAVVVALAAGASGFASPALAAPSGASAASSPATTPTRVSPTPAPGTPTLAKTKALQNIRQIVQCGGTMYAVGEFSEINQKGVEYSRPGLFSFSATAPYTLTSLDANVNGQVNSIAFVGGICTDAYIGGSFTSVNGTPATNIAEISIPSGDVVPTFASDANGEVDTLAGYQDHLLVGGKFTQINGDTQNLFASLSPTTGQSDGFVNLNITGHVDGNPPQVYNQQISHGGTLDLVEGNFTSMGGQSRTQIAMLNLAGSTAQVTPWTSKQFNGRCHPGEAFYVRSAAWGPGDTSIYIADTGRNPLNWQHTYPLTGLCDAVAKFSATQAPQTDNWIDYAGCDSFYSVAADTSAIYAAGHPRWTNNSFGCNFAGKGAFKDYGLQGFNPTTGKVLKNSSGKALYSMSRANADSMLLLPPGSTGAGLWIGSSNRYGAQWCGGVSGHSGVCYLPYSS
jgi:hypothetical protein